MARVPPAGAEFGGELALTLSHVLRLGVHRERRPLRIHALGYEIAPRHLQGPLSTVPPSSVTFFAAAKASGTRT